MSTFYWRTRRGEEAPNAKLDRDARRLIRQRRGERATYQEIAHELGVCPETVRRYDHGISYEEAEE